MHAHVLAEALTAFVKPGDGSDSLVLETDSGGALFCFRQESSEAGGRLCWDASPTDPREGGTLNAAQMGWLQRAGFRHADGRLSRSSAVPYTIEAARLIAGLTAYLLEKAYDLSPDAPVRIRWTTPEVGSRKASAA